MRLIVILLVVIIIIADYCECYSAKRRKSRRYRNSLTKRKQSRLQYRRPNMYRQTDNRGSISVDFDGDNFNVGLASQYVSAKRCGISGLVGQRIVNGKDASVGEYPWIVSIHSWDDPLGCAGSIINERWIVSAAHCYKSKNGKYSQAYSLSIKVGSIYSTKGTKYQISRLVIHNRYNHDRMENSDIALLMTDRPILVEYYGKINTVNAICLPSTPYSEPSSNQILVIGWGKTKENNVYLSQVLKEVVLPMISDQQCARIFARPIVDYPNGYTVYKSQICTHSENKDACQGDSGGPAMVFENGRGILVGVVSYGVGCATDFPGVFTQVSYFLDWIATNAR